jgi:hypothetical protein
MVAYVGPADGVKNILDKLAGHLHILRQRSDDNMVIIGNILHNMTIYGNACDFRSFTR